MEAFNLLPDPQTNGGLLFSVKESGVDEVIKLLNEAGLEKFAEPVGRFIKQEEKLVQVKL
jgi:selenide,water dikinase